MKMILRQWNLMRYIRLLLGLGILLQGVNDKDTLKTICGLVLSAMAIANIGCSGTNVCSVSSNSTKIKLADKGHQ